MLDKGPEFLVIGSGIAGARAALELSRAGDVLVLAKSSTGESSTRYAQGGIAVALNEGDSVDLHYDDTMAAGAGVCDGAATRVLVREGPLRVRELLDWGAEFDRIRGSLDFTREAAHSRNRILHAGGDATGREIGRALIRHARASSNIHLQPHSCAVDLLVGSSGCEGVRFVDPRSGESREIRAGRVLLATGGLGAAFRETTNPAVATGDGFALALRAGAVLADMEFVQFHPTALKLQGARPFLLTEALRGEGAYLCDAQGGRFMSDYHPLEELAPRDIVARAIVREVGEERDGAAFLDLRHLDSRFVERRFPTVFSLLLEFNLDPARDLIPVFPAAHYIMGGIAVDLWGRTSIPGLYAAGEVACTGAHGANRLASNSLLDGLVFGARAGQAMTGEASVWSPPPGERPGTAISAAGPGEPLGDRTLQDVLMDRIGLVRTAEGLKEAISLLGPGPLESPREVSGSETENIRLNGLVMAAAALTREESRGGHYRMDFPAQNDGDWRCHSLVEFSLKSDRLTVTRTRTLQETEV